MYVHDNYYSVHKQHYVEEVATQQLQLAEITSLPPDILSVICTSRMATKLTSKGTTTQTHLCCLPMGTSTIHLEKLNTLYTIATYHYSYVNTKKLP